MAEDKNLDSIVGLLGIGDSFLEDDQKELIKKAINDLSWQARLGDLRADVRKMSSEWQSSQESEHYLYQSVLDMAGSVLGASRAGFSKFLSEDIYNSTIKCVLEYCAESAPHSLDEEIPAFVAKHFIPEPNEIIAVTRENMYDRIPGLLAKTAIKFFDSFFNKYDLESLYFIPFTVDEKTEGILSIEYDKNNENERPNNENIRSVLEELVNIVSTSISQKRTKDELKESEERFRVLTSSALDAIIEMDNEGKINFCNPAAEDLFGYEIKDVFGKNINKIIVSEKEFRESDTGFESYKETGKGAIVGMVTELYAKHKDGHEFPVELTISPVEKEGNYGASAIIRDITKRKKAEEAINKIFNAVTGEIGQKSLDNITNGLSEIFNAECALISEIGENNQANAISMVMEGKYIKGYSYDLKGSPCEDVIGKGFCYFPKNITSLFPKDIDLVKMDAVGYVGIPIVNTKGEYNGVLCAISKNELDLPNNAEQIMGILASKVSVEIERKNALDALEKSENKHRLLSENITDSVWIMGLDTSMTYFSPSIEEFRGYTADEALKIPLEESLTPESLNVATNILMTELRKEHEPGIDPNRRIMLELEHYKKDGSTVWGEVRTSFLRNSEGIPTEVIGVTRDITQRKKAEDNLKESEERHRLLLLNSPDLIILQNKNGDVDYISPHVETITGYDEEEFVGKNFPEIIHPDDLEEIIVANQTAMQGNTIVNVEYRIIHKNGETKWLSHTTRPIVVDGKLISVQSNIRDITESKKAETELRESKETLNRMFQFTDYMVCIADLEKGYFTKLSPAFEKHLGWTEEEMLSKPILDFIYPDDMQKTADVIRDQTERGDAILNFENRYVTKEGSVRWLEWAAHPFPEEGITYSVAYDITERKKAEQDLKESEELYRTLVQTSTDGVILTDLEGNYIFCNEKHANILGYKSENLIGKNGFSFIVPSDQETAKKYVGGLFSENNSDSIVLNLRKKDGTVITTEHSAALIKDGFGKETGIMCLTRDITEKRKAEEERKIIETKLLQSQKMETIGRLAGGVAHDFNNLLAAIVGNAELIKEELHPDSPHVQGLNDISTAVSRGSKLTGQLLRFARETKLELKPVNINEIVQSSLNMFERTNKGLLIGNDCNYEDDEKIYLVEADIVQIERVLLNIYNNAVDAMENTPDKNRVLSVKTNNITLDDESKDLPVGKYVEISVHDNGEGMSHETISKIFEPFYTTKKVGKGTGLGLSTSQGVMKQHNGNILVDSVVGEGTTIKLYLPTTTKSLVHSNAPISSYARGEGTILVVDDESTLREVSEKMLNRIGYDVITANDGKQGVETYRENKSKVVAIILDMIMPNMDGAQAYKIIKKENPDAVVILSSGYSAGEKREEMEKLGCKHFLEKPFRMDQVSKMLYNAINDVEIE